MKTILEELKEIKAKADEFIAGDFYNLIVEKMNIESKTFDCFESALKIIKEKEE